MTTAPPFIIEETTGPKRSITLRGRSLPYRGLQLGGTQRVTINYFPGNPVGTAQVVGATYEPTTIRGTWKDIFLYQGPTPNSPLLGALGMQAGGSENSALLRNFPALGPAALPDTGNVRTSGGATFTSSGSIPGNTGLAQKARVLRDAFELLRRSGQLLRVQWGSIVRFGFITKAVFSHDREADIQYEIDFSWIGDTSSSPVVEKVPGISASGLLKRLQGYLDEVTSILETYALIASRYYLRIRGKLLSQFNSITSFMDALEKFVSFTLVPADMYGVLKQQLVSIRTDAIDVINDVRSTPASYSPRLSKAPQEEVDNSAAFELATIVAMAKLGAFSTESIREIESLEIDELLATYVATGKVTLRDISTKFYGVPDHWTNLASYNGIPNSTPAPGTIVRIPRLRSGA